jgi:Na+-transporting methylmalonyl-CoA/oxaloacetate decarboxylase beta subunit
MYSRVMEAFLAAAPVRAVPDPFVPRSVEVIGGADGPTAIFVAGRVSGLIWAGLLIFMALAAAVWGAVLWSKRRRRGKEKQDGGKDHPGGVL